MVTSRAEQPMRKSSSGASEDVRLFWRDGREDPSQFVFVDYYVETPFELEAAAVFMADTGCWTLGGGICCGRL